MATRDLTPQDEDGSNEPYTPDENGGGVKPQDGSEDSNDDQE